MKKVRVRLRRSGDLSNDFSLICPCCKQELFTYNITHNLAKMVNVYAPIWHPNDPPFPRYEKAMDLIPLLAHGLEMLYKDPKYYRTFEPENKWGTYDGLIKALEAIKHACFEYQQARPEASI